jgi:hypothetical protein
VGACGRRRTGDRRRDCRQPQGLQTGHALRAERRCGVQARHRRRGGSQIKIPDEITIPIGIDLDEKYGLGAGGKYTSEATIGTVKVCGGRVYYDGKPIDEGDQAAIAAACKKMCGND